MGIDIGHICEKIASICTVMSVIDPRNTGESNEKLDMLAKTLLYDEPLSEILSDLLILIKLYHSSKYMKNILNLTEIELYCNSYVKINEYILKMELTGQISYKMLCNYHHKNIL